MGMDLIAINPKVPHGTNCSALHYNWTGWNILYNLLDHNNVDLSEFRGSNDGAIISDETCTIVADVLDEIFDALSSEYQEWLRDHSFFWRNCGGCEQW